MSAGSMMIGLVNHSHGALTQSFVRDHIDRLDRVVCVLSGRRLDRVHGVGEVLPRTRWRRLMERFPAYRAGSGRRLEAAQAGVLRSAGVRVVLAEFAESGLAIHAAAQRAGLPLVVHCHGVDAHHERFLSENEAALRAMAEYASAVVVVSEPMADSVRRRMGASAERVRLIPYGVDPGLFSAGDPGASCVFLAVGRFVEKKAPHLLILAFAQVVRAVPEARLVVVGDGPLKPACEQLVRALGLGEAVSLVGPEPRERVAGRMRLARAFVQHSVRAPDGDCEGSPVAITEAAVSGLPVVSTRHANIPRIVIEGRTGLLCEEHDVKGMAEAWIELARDGDLAARMGRAARAHACSEFSLDGQIGKLQAVLEESAR